MKIRIILATLLSLIALTGCAATKAPQPATSGVSTPDVAEPQKKMAGVEYVDVVKPCPENQPVVALDPALFDTAPTGTTWYLNEELNDGHLPNIPGGGPMQITADGFRHCYTHSPKGVIAAAHALPSMGNNKFIARTVLWLKADWPNRNQVYEETLAHSFSPRPRPAQPDEFVAFRLESYSPERAVVTLVWVTPAGPQLRAMTYAFVWQDNDWRIEVQTNGQATSATDYQVRQIPSLEGYVKWKK